MRKLVFGAFSPSVSLHVYEEDGGFFIDHSLGQQLTLKECVMILSSLLKGDIDRDEHYLLRRTESGWFCEFVAKYYPKSEVFVIGYGDTEEAAKADCQRRLAELS